MPSPFLPVRQGAHAHRARGILDSAPHGPGAQPSLEQRSGAITPDSAVRRANMPDGDAPAGGAPAAPPNRSNQEGIAYPPLGWNEAIPAGQQVCTSSDEDQVRICCPGAVGSFARHAMCLVDVGEAAAKTLYECIAGKTDIVRDAGVGVACNEGGNSSTIFVTAKGVSSPERKSGDLYYNKSGARRVTLGAGMALVAIGVLSAV